jgi:hypothetical protein
MPDSLLARNTVVVFSIVVLYALLFNKLMYSSQTSNVSHWVPVRLVFWTYGQEL